MLPTHGCAHLCEPCVARNTRPAVYLIRGGDLVKIGFSTNILQRLAALRYGSPVPLTLWYLHNGDVALERSFHKHFAADRSHGEWFHVSEAISDFVAAAWECQWESQHPEFHRSDDRRARELEDPANS